MAREGKSQNTSCLLTWMYLRMPCVCIFFLHFLRHVFFLSTLPLMDHDLSSQYDSTVPGCFLTLIIAASWFTTGAILSVGSSWSGKSIDEERLCYCAESQTSRFFFPFFFSFICLPSYSLVICWILALKYSVVFQHAKLIWRYFYCGMNLLWKWPFE